VIGGSEATKIPFKLRTSDETECHQLQALISCCMNAVYKYS